MTTHTRNSFHLLALIAGFELMQTESARADGDALHIFGYVRDHQGSPIVGVDVVGDNYVGDFEISTTDTNGFYKIEGEPEVNLRVQVSCEQLAERNFTCVPEATLTLSADDIQVDFVVTNTFWLAPRPVLTALSWRTNRFSMLLTGATNQNYTIQVSTALRSTNWTSLFVTNSPTATSFIVSDPHATNAQRFYRVLTGP